MVLVFVAVAAAAFPAKFIADDQRPESNKWNPPQCNTTGYTFNCCDQLDFTVTIPFEGPCPPPLLLSAKVIILKINKFLLR